MKRLLILMGVVGALAIGVFAVAGAGAQEDSPSATPEATDETEGEGPRERFLDRLAENLGISRDELDSAIDQTQLDLIDEAVEEGRITEEKADELRERVANGEPLFPRFHDGRPGPGPGPFFRGIHWIFEASAELLGIEVSDLRAQFAEGKSPGEIAEENGYDLDAFKTDLLAAAKEDLQAKVDEGELTQEMADRIYEGFENNIDRILEAKHAIGLSIPGDGTEGGFEEHFRIGPPGEDFFFEGGVFGPGGPRPFRDILPGLEPPVDEGAIFSDA